MHSAYCSAQPSSAKQTTGIKILLLTLTRAKSNKIRSHKWGFCKNSFIIIYYLQKRSLTQTLVFYFAQGTNDENIKISQENNWCDSLWNQRDSNFRDHFHSLIFDLKQWQASLDKVKVVCFAFQQSSHVTLMIFSKILQIFRRRSLVQCKVRMNIWLFKMVEPISVWISEKHVLQKHGDRNSRHK